MENKRRIAIYLDSRKPLTKIELNHSYNSKMIQILNKEGGTKASVARMLLNKFFGTKEASELREKIIYASDFIIFSEGSADRKNTGMGSKVGRVCQVALKKAIDSYQLSA